MSVVKMSVACLALVACALPGACAHTPKQAAPELRAVDYWPLAVGNSWTYRISLRGAVQQESVSIVSKDADGFFVDSQGAKLKHHAAGVFDGERFMLRDPVELGAKWMAVPSANSMERFEIVSRGFTATVPAGIFENCVRVQAVNRVNADEALIAEWTYAPRVGLIHFQSRREVADQEPQPQTEMSLTAFEVKTGT